MLSQIPRYRGTYLGNSQGVEEPAKLDTSAVLDRVNEFRGRAFGEAFELKEVIFFETEEIRQIAPPVYGPRWPTRSLHRGLLYPGPF